MGGNDEGDYIRQIPQPSTATASEEHLADVELVEGRRHARVEPVDLDRLGLQGDADVPLRRLADQVVENLQADGERSASALSSA